MTGLKLELIECCHNIFAECEEFKTHELLRAVFITPELSEVSYALPETKDIKARAQITTGYLLQNMLDDNTPMLLPFIETLITHYGLTDKRHEKLKHLRNKIDEEFTISIRGSVSCVVMAMTVSEAEDLFQGSVFKNSTLSFSQSEIERFNNFKNILEKYDMDGKKLVSSYGDKREDWIPYINDKSTHIGYKSTIESIMINTLKYASGISLISVTNLEFKSDNFFPRVPVSEMDIALLKQSGFILIIDAISLFHPKLNNNLLQSQILQEPNVAIVVLSPIDTNTNSISELIEEQIQTRVEAVYKRFDEKLDKLCEFSISELRSLRRWLSDIVPRIRDGVQRPLPENKIVLNQNEGKPIGRMPWLISGGKNY